MIKNKPNVSFQDQIYRNIVSGWLAILLVVVANIVITPILLNSLGKEVYGIWFLIFNFLAYFYLTDFGITNAITRLYAKYKVDPNYDSAKLVSTAYVLVLIIDVSLLFALLTFKDDVYSFLGIKSQFYRIFTLLFYIGLFELMTQFILRVNIGILKGSHKYDIAYRFEGLAAGLRLSAVVVLVYLDSFDVVFFAALYSGSKVLSDTISFHYLREELKGFKFNFDKRSFTDLFDVGTSSLLTSLAGALLISLPILLFGKFFGVEKVFLYAVPFAISIILMRFINAVYHGVTPKAAELKALDEEGEIFSISSFGVKFTTLLCFCILLFFIVFGEELITLWLGTSVVNKHEFEMMHNILLVLLSYVFLETVQKVNIFIYKSVGLHWLVSIEVVCSVVLFYLISVGFFEYAQELIFALALFCVGCFKYCYYRMVGRQKIKTFSLPFMLILPIGGILISALQINQIEDLMIKVVIFGFVFIAFSFLFFKYVFSAREQKTISSQLILLRARLSPTS